MESKRKDIRQHGNELFTPDEVIGAIRRCNGILAATARELKTSRNTVRRYIETYPDVAAVYKEASETVLDLAEQRLFRAVNNGSIRAIMFLLKTKGKHRGYMETTRQELTGADGLPLGTSPNIDLSVLSDDELEMFEQLIAKATVADNGKRSGAKPDLPENDLLESGNGRGNGRNDYSKRDDDGDDDNEGDTD